MVSEDTWSKLDKLKRFIAFCVGFLIVVVSILSIVNPSSYDDNKGSNAFIRPLGIITSLWNIIFAALIILVQLKWTNWVGMRFGFLLSPLFRGFFYVFVGTSVLLPINSEADGISLGVFSWVVGFSAITLGGIECIVGGKCTREDDVVIGARSKRNIEVEPPALAGPGGIPEVAPDQGSRKGGTFSKIFGGSSRSASNSNANDGTFNVRAECIPSAPHLRRATGLICAGERRRHRRRPARRVQSERHGPAGDGWRVGSVGSGRQPVPWEWEP